MKAQLRTFAFFCTGLLLLWISPNHAAPIVQGDISLLYGKDHYFSTEYIEAIQHTKSIIQTNKRSKGYDRIWVYRGDGWVRFDVGTFDGVYQVFAVNRHGELIDPGVTLEGSPGIKTTEFRPEKLLIERADHFSLVINGKSHIYQYVPKVGSNIDELLNSHILAGIYRDKNGKTYRFTPKGTAMFPSKSFTYGIDTGHYGLEFDRFAELRTDGTAIRWYGFRVSGDELKLYDVGGEMNQEIATEPFVVLKRMSN